MSNLVKHSKPAHRDALRRAWVAERDAARTARQRGDRALVWHHLERAHILSQPLPGPHVRTHLAMLIEGLRRHDRREVLGQIVRTALAGPGSLTRRYPLGNTGVARVSATQPMPVPDDLRALLAV